MEKAFEEELKYNQQRAWFGYVRTYSHKCHFVFKHLAKGQRAVRCRRCGTKIPKEVPRIFISGSWYYWTGHYCLKCASKVIEEDIKNKTDLVNELRENIEDLTVLFSIVSKTVQKDRYKDLMSLGYLCSKLEGKQY